MRIPQAIPSTTPLFMATICSLSVLASSPTFASATATLQAPAKSVGEIAPGAQATKLQISAGVIGKSMEDRLVNSKWAGGQLGLVGVREFFENMSGTLDLSFLMSAGTFSNQYGEEGLAPTAFWVNEASIAYQPLKILKLEGGVIPMSFSSAPSALDAPGFPALRQSLLWERETFKASLFAAQAIPTSGTRAVKPSENGITTSFTAFGASVGIGTNDRRPSPIALNTSLMRYDFRHLNASAATDSQYLGNTVVAPGSQARFKYGFGGYEATAGLKVRVTPRWSTHASGAFIRNDLAPEPNNKGYQYVGGFGWAFGEREVTLSGGYFYNESDTIPGTYASMGKGYNNRFGNTARIGFEDKKEQISGFVQYVHSNEIEDRPYTADRSTVTFGLEAAYDVL